MTITADVNTTFDGQRADQIASYYQNLATKADRIARAEADVASGKLADMGGGRYRVMTGFDRGEIFNFSAQGLMLPQSGLMTDLLGKELGYFAQPEWHGLGTVIDGGTTDIDKILEVSGLGFQVSKRQVRYNYDGDLFTYPDGFITVREDTGSPLGMVGTRYTPVQNEDGFSFLAELLGKAEILPVSAFGLRGGSQCVIALRLPEDVVIDAEGFGDHIVPFVMASNSHDGRSPFRCVVTPWRPRCSNTERLALRDAITSWTVPHYRNALTKIKAARQALGLTVKYYETFTADENALAHTTLADAEIDALLAEFDTALWPDKAKDQTEGKGTKSKRSETTRRARTEAVRDILGVERERVGQTAYAVERSYTDFLDHVAPHRIAGTPNGAAMATAIVEGAEDKRKAQVHQRLMLTVK